MAKADPSKAPKSPAATQADTPAAPAQQVWLAGLSAMAKAQQQGSAAIKALVNDGLAFQRQSQSEAQQRLHEATERLTHMASDFGQQATGRVDKLEHLFEDRVAKALHRLGMPSLLEIQMLTERVAQLEAQLAAQVATPLATQRAAPLATQRTAKAKAPAPRAAPAAKTRAAAPAKARPKSV